MTNEMPPESEKIKPETATATRDPLTGILERLNETKRVLSEQIALITQEADKRKEQLQEMVEEVMSMSKGNEKLQKNLDKIYKQDPSKKLMMINEEKFKVRSRTREIDDKIGTINAQITSTKETVDQAMALPDYHNNNVLKESVVQISNQLEKAREAKEELISLRQETEDQIGEIDRRWANIEAEGLNVAKDNIGFAVKEVFDAHDPVNIKEIYGERISDLKVNETITLEELWTAVNKEREKRATEEAEAGRLKAREEAERRDAETEKQIDTFIKEASGAIDAKKAETLTNLGDFKRRIEDTGPEGVKAKITDAFVKIPDLLAPKKTFGFVKKGTHKDLAGAERVYDETRGLIESLKRDFDNLSADGLFKVVSDTWSKNKTLPTIEGGAGTFYYESTIYTELSKIFNNSVTIERVLEKITVLSRQLQTAVGEINIKRGEVEEKLNDPKEGLLRHPEGNQSTLSKLQSSWTFYTETR